MCLLHFKMTSKHSLIAIFYCQLLNNDENMKKTQDNLIQELLKTEGKVGLCYSKLLSFISAIY